MLVMCATCGKELTRSPASIRRYSKSGLSFCSPKCRAEHTSRTYWASRQLLICPVCKKEFKRAPSSVKRYSVHYCSHECAIKGRTLERVEQTCHYCGKTFMMAKPSVTKGTIPHCKTCRHRHAYWLKCNHKEAQSCA